MMMAAADESLGASPFRLSSSSSIDDIDPVLITVAVSLEIVVANSTMSLATVEPSATVCTVVMVTTLKYTPCSIAINTNHLHSLY